MLKRWLISIIINAVALIAVSQLFDSFYIKDFKTALLASLILSVINFIVRPILIILTLPITLLSLGLFLFVINAITLIMTANIIGPSFFIANFGTAILASIILSILNLLLQKLLIDTLKQ